MSRTFGNIENVTRFEIERHLQFKNAFQIIEKCFHNPKTKKTHYYLLFDGFGIMQRLLIFSVFFSLCLRNGYIFYFKWNPNQTCPGYFRNCFDILCFSLSKQTTQNDFPFCRIFDLTPVLMKVEEKEKEKEKPSTDKKEKKKKKNCNCGLKPKIHVPEMKKISPLSSYQIHSGGFELHSLDSTFSCCRKRWQIACFTFFFRLVRLTPSLKQTVLQFHSSNLGTASTTVGIYMHSAFLKEIPQLFLALQTLVQDCHSKLKTIKLFFCTNHISVQKKLQNKLEKNGMSKISIFAPGEIDGGFGLSKTRSSPDTTLAHCYLLASCSKQIFFCQKKEAAKWNQPSNGYYFYLAAFCITKARKSHHKFHKGTKKLEEIILPFGL